MSSNLEHSPAQITSSLLVALGVGTAPGSGGDWPVSYSSEPDRPDQAVTVYDTTGTDEGSAGGEFQGHHGVQVRVRARTHGAGWSKANEALRALEAVRFSEVTIDSSVYTVQCYAKSAGVNSLGRARNSTSVLFTLNLLASVTGEAAVVIPDGALQDENGGYLLDQDGDYLLGAA